MINTECTFVPMSIVYYLEQRFQGKYVFDSCLQTTLGGWSQFAAIILYRENNYVGLYPNSDRKDWLCVDASDAIVGSFTGIEAKNGEIIYSRYKTHQCFSKDKSVFITGGRDLVFSSPGKLVNFKVEGDRLVIVD